MPMHDRSKVAPRLFHDFHQSWSVGIRNALNRGLPPQGYFALVEPKVDIPSTDRDDMTRYARKANRILVSRGLVPAVAVVEISCLGDSHKIFATRRCWLSRLQVGRFIGAGSDSPFRLFVSRWPEDNLALHVECVRMGDDMPDMPLFLTEDYHVVVPPEATYRAAWAACPAPVRKMVAPNSD